MVPLLSQPMGWVGWFRDFRAAMGGNLIYRRVPPPVPTPTYTHALIGRCVSEWLGRGTRRSLKHHFSAFSRVGMRQTINALHDADAPSAVGRLTDRRWSITKVEATKDEAVEATTMRQQR